MMITPIEPVNRYLCVFALTRGYRNPILYIDLLIRTLHIYEATSKLQDTHGVDHVLFHEGNISEFIQGWFKKIFPDLRFINIREIAFQLNEKNEEAYNKSPKRERLGFMHMCRFNAILMPKLLARYEYVCRVDEDGIVGTYLPDPATTFEENKSINLVTRLKLEDHHTTNITFKKFLCSYFEREILPDAKAFFLEMEKLPNFYNNFYVQSMNFWQREEVKQFLDTVDDSGGIYSDRWGDSTIQSAAYFLFNKVKIGLLEDFNYTHGSHSFSVSRSNNKEWTNNELDLTALGVGNHFTLTSTTFRIARLLKPFANFTRKLSNKLFRHL